MKTEEFLVYTDGGARGNPGPAGIGVVIKLKTKNEKLKTIKEIFEYIGETTNNQAEYRAVIKALEWIISNFQFPISNFRIECFMDSQLIVEQLNGRYKIKNKGLKPLYGRVRELIMELGDSIIFQYIPREQNKDADRLVNQAISFHLSK